MSLRTPIFTVVCCACALPAARTTASAVEPMSFFIPLLPVFWPRRGPARCSTRCCSHSQIIVELVHVGLQVGIGEPVDHLAVLQDIVAIRDGRGEPEVLLHQQNGKSLRLEGADGPADLLDDD